MIQLRQGAHAESHFSAPVVLDRPDATRKDVYVEPSEFRELEDLFLKMF